MSDLVISWILRTGVAISGALVVMGMVLVFTRAHGVEEINYPHTPRAVIASAARGDGEGIAMLGLLLLIATPVIRVAASIVLFAREGDYTFVAITSTVLLLLLLSFALGAAGG